CETRGDKCEESCAADDLPSCTKLAGRLKEGRGITKNEAKAAELYKKACDGGEQRACAELGAFSRRGQGGLPKDPLKAANLFKQACDGGSAHGCGLLGELVEKGEGGMTKDE